MSEDSEKTNLNVKESETPVSENNSCKPGEKIKRNYCYICKVQCTAQKNFEAHEKGKKHIKNLSLLPGDKTKRKNVKKKVSPQEKGIVDQNRNEQRCKKLKQNQRKRVFCSKSKKKKEINEVGNKTKKRKIIFLSVPKDEKKSKRIKNKKILAKLKKKRDSVNKKKSQKDTTLLETPEPNATDSAACDSQNMDSSFDNTPKRKMNHTNYQKPKNKRYQYVNPDYEDRFSRYQNAKYSYSNNYENQGFEYNSRFHSNHSQWNDMHSRNTSFPPYKNYQNYRHPGQQYSGAEYSSPYFTKDREDAFNSWNDSSQNEYFPSNNFENSLQNPDQTDYNSYKACDEMPFQSNSTTPDNLTKSNRKIYVANHSSSPLLRIECTVSKPNQTSVSADDRYESASESTNCDDAKQGGKKQIRSRSLSSSENLDRVNGMKNKLKTVIDSDGATEEQKIRKWTDSLLDTGHNRISRLIHPSNYKEKAAVNHLITKFSKSKRKENLTRKLRSNSLGSTENNEDDSENVNLSSNSLTTEEISMTLNETANATIEQSSNLDKNRNSLKNNNLPKEIKSMKSSLKNSDTRNSQDLSDLIDLVSDARNSVKKDSKCSEMPSNKKSVEGKNSEETLPITPEICSKRKKISTTPGNREKKRKIIKNQSPQRIASTTDIPTRENSPNLISPESLKVTESVLTSNKVSEIKNELFESSEVNNGATTSVDKNSQNLPDQNFALNSEFSVESLIQLFATGNVKVKEEFNDPVMDAIRGMNPDELINACSNQPFLDTNVQVQNKAPVDCNKNSSKSKPTSTISPDENIAHLSPVIIGSAVVNEDPTPAAVNSISSNATSSETPNKSSKEAEALSENVNVSDETKAKSEPSELDKLITKLQLISSQEETVKQNLCEAKSKISEYSSLLEEWKNKKKKLQVEEEGLRKQRNEIISQMRNSVKTSKDPEEEESSASHKNNNTDKSLKQSKINNEEKQNPKDSKEITRETKKSCISTVSVTVVEKPKKIKTSISLELDEITILPPPVKEKPPVINIIDDAEENASVAKNIQSGSNYTSDRLVTNVVSSSSVTGSTMFDVKNVPAHTTIINCLVVFEDFLYTCSNDNTAKRFCLKDASLAVTYFHAAKNVVEVVVEKVQNEALVFTSCSARVISLFIASSGTKIKTFYPPCAVMSICKGWGKFYAGLENGSVNCYDWKYEEREIVKTESPATRIATAHQGRLHVLVILSSDGHIAIRDAETGLLIRAIKVFVKHPAWMTVYNDLAYLSSSEKFIIVLDILTGRIEKRLYLSSYSTGLAVYEDHIFTISYNGIINCLNKDKICDKKLFYGAGKMGLTCIHVYQNWVFTGNRKGNVSLFQFDPNDSEICKFSKCDITYGLREDLEYHVEKDHLSKKKSSLLKCPWRGCECVFSKESDMEEKMDHLKKHIYPRHLLL